MNKKVAVAVAGLAFIGSSMSNIALAEGKEQCFGVAKAGKNDCATKTSSCMGTSKVDGQKDAFIVVPKGLCERLSGGSLKSS